MENSAAEGINSGSIQLDHLGLHRLSNLGLCNPTPWVKAIEFTWVMFCEEVFRKAGHHSMQGLKTGLFSLREEIEFMPNVIDHMKYVTSCTDSKVRRPVKMIFTIASIGKSSAMFHVDAVDPGHKKVLLKSAMAMVLVDRQKRRPTPYPSDFRALMNSQKTPAYKWTDSPLKAIPADASVFSWGRKVSSSETDFNGHANHSLFVLLPLECIGEAIANGFPISLNGNLSQCVVKKISFLILSEASLGKVLMAEMWESSDELFHFILSVDGKVSAYVTLSFFKM